jgi:uncharacterized protein (DUF885 family)
MSRVFDIADQYVDQLAALDPSGATAWGVPGHDSEMTDYSPDGSDAVADLDRRTLRELAAAPIEDEHDRIARDCMTERFNVRLDTHAAGEQLRALRIIASPMSSIRSVFDQMPRATDEHWRNIAARLALVPRALDGFRRSLALGAERGLVAAKRQVRECAAQAEIWSGLRPGQPSFFNSLLDSFDRSGVSSPALRGDLESGVRAAESAYARFRAYLLDEYLAKAADADGVGRERYTLNSRSFNGCELDFDETYRWGWDELYRVEREMEQTARRIAPGGSIADALHLLETDPARLIEGIDAYRAWLQDLHDRALDDLDGRHFDIDPRVKVVEVTIPPAGGALAPYYSGPSEDFSRPGRTWWPIGTRTRFPLWGEVSTAYHEGVPGHHLQVGAVRCLGGELSRYQRTLGFISGHGEGWALYAERLMGELGYLDNPDHYMGMLSAQAMRCVRVIIDIGLHLQLPIPASERFHCGEVWSHDMALAFAVERSLRPREFMASEVVRYLGWPAQAISYKVGERAWLAARDAARQGEGAAFDLKRFHTRALNLGPMGLDQLARELARATGGDAPA